MQTRSQTCFKNECSSGIEFRVFHGPLRFLLWNRKLNEFYEEATRTSGEYKNKAILAITTQPNKISGNEWKQSMNCFDILILFYVDDWIK